MRPDWISRASVFAGILFLLLGTLAADSAFGGDYDEEYNQCALYCTSTNGIDMEGKQWPSIEECILKGCAKYKNVNCSLCKSCPGSGYFIPCTNTGENCGGVGGECTNGLCSCKFNLTEEIGGSYYECFCGRP